jgi:hypothetical protein
MTWVPIPGLAVHSPEQQALALAGAVFDLIMLQVILALQGPIPAGAAYALQHHRVRLSGDQGEVLIWVPERQDA